MAGIEPVEEALAGEEVGLGALLGEHVDLAPAVLLELVLGERGLRQDLGEKREAGVEILLENGEARDRRVAARGDLEDRREVVDRFGELRARSALRVPPRNVSPVISAVPSRPGGSAALPAPGKRIETATVGRRPQRAARTARPFASRAPVKEGRREGQRGQRRRGQAAHGAHAASLDSPGSLGTTVTTERRCGDEKPRRGVADRGARPARGPPRRRRGKRPGSPS